MPADLTTLTPLILIALVALVLAVWIFTRLNRKARITDLDSAPGIVRDVLEEGAAPAPRNQALIDAPRGIAVVPGPPSAAAPLGTQAEAGVATTAATTSPAAAPAGAGDDLTRIKGLGPKIAALLGELGVTTYAQIAAMTPEDVERLDTKLGRFSGRITRDQWVEQAQLLAAGDEAGFSATFGNNG